MLNQLFDVSMTHYEVRLLRGHARLEFDSGLCQHQFML